ncbi:penicillin-binding protein 1C [Fibrobacterota bacterium]
MLKSLSIRKWHLAALIPVLLLIWLFWPVGSLFPCSYSTVIYDKNGKLLRAFLAEDEQLRFSPITEALPKKYITSVITYEDKRFFYHPGFDPLALVHAAFTNITGRKRLRGGSTITMQVIRLSKPRKRTYVTKLIECFLSIKLTMHKSKTEILKLYASHVPMGGNNVGIEAASYRYFGKPLCEITWAEAALFTVLPNAPSMINLDRKRPHLKKKRDYLLSKLHEKKIIDSLTLQLSLREPLPRPDRKMPFHAPHFTQFVHGHYPQPTIHTTLDYSIQDIVNATTGQLSLPLKQQGIYNLSVLVVETQTGKVRAYKGSQSFFDSLHNGQVDGVQAFRSTGSLLKPFLVAQAIDQGPFTMISKVRDVPTFYGTFSPQNASKHFRGLITLEELLIRSLNVPAVRLLHYTGLDDFYQFLKSAGLKGLFRTSEGYGLTLIIGGSEASLWELTRMFAGLGNLGMQKPFTVINDDKENRDTSPDISAEYQTEFRLCSEGAAWLVLNVLRKLTRPGSEHYWYLFTQQVSVAWKTGTSYGQKDAWAIGTNRQWTIGIWVGNFTGEGNAVLSGAKSAGPILFSLFNQLSDKSAELWFEKPEYDLARKKICKLSGYTPGPYCKEVVYAEQPSNAYKTRICPFHKKFLISKKTGYVTCSRCWQIPDTTWAIKAVYSPSVRSILDKLGHKLDTIPLHNPHCPAIHKEKSIDILYPVNGISILTPRNIKGEYEKVVFKANYQRKSGLLFWYLDNQFIGETIEQHTVPVNLEQGKHHLVIQDSEGSTSSVRFRSHRR